MASIWEWVKSAPEWIGTGFQLSIIPVAIDSALVLGIFSIGIMLVVVKRQNRLTAEVRDRVFGTLTDFGDIHHNVLSLIQEANQRPTSELAIMCYWTWFGIDQEDKVKNRRTDDDIYANQSAIRQAIFRRATKGYPARIVVYDPGTARTELEKFLQVVFRFQRNPLSADSIPKIIEKYISDVQDLEREMSKHSGFVNGERKIVRAASIPLLLFSALDKSGWGKAIVYIGETQALENDGETGGFVTSDMRMVRIIQQHIQHISRS